ncbi:MAG: arginine--tRNA ligase [Angelakisella sp.]
MISIFEQARQQLITAIGAALAQAMEAGTLPRAEIAPFVVEVPADTARGDFATNAAMVNAKALRQSPQKIAQAIVANLDLSGCYAERVETAGPGFINFFVKPQWFADIVSEIAQKGEQYGHTDYGHGQKVMVEYVSANPTGPMHMGNARGGALGDVLAEALAWSGHDTTREFYVNDAGNQIEKFGISLEARYIQHLRGEDAAVLPEDAYQGSDIIDHAVAFAAEYGEQYLNCDSRQRRDALIAYALPKNVAKLESDLARYRIHYDVWFRESTLHPDAIQRVLEVLRSRNAVYELDGALWYKATDFGGDKDEVLVRANGLPTYFAADIAYHYNKFAVRGFDKVINVWGADHHGHVARLKGAMDAIGLDGSKLDIVLMQLVRLMKDGEPYRMSKRSGKSISLSDLLEEVPLDAARFFFIMREAGSALDFDLSLAAEQSAKNPVFYVQYAHARICSMLKNLAAEGIAADGERYLTVSPAALLVLTAPEERALIRRLGQLPQEIINAACAYDPAGISSYITDVATLFHKFYTACRVKGEPEELLYPRLALCHATRTVLKNTLALLKITSPEVM